MGVLVRVISLALLAALLVAGCSQASSPVERQERRAGVEEPGPESVDVPAEVPEYTLTKDEAADAPAGTAPAPFSVLALPSDRKAHQ